MFQWNQHGKKKAERCRIIILWLIEWLWVENAMQIKKCTRGTWEQAARKMSKNKTLMYVDVGGDDSDEGAGRHLEAGWVTLPHPVSPSLTADNKTLMRPSPKAVAATNHGWLQPLRGAALIISLCGREAAEAAAGTIQTKRRGREDEDK